VLNSAGWGILVGGDLEDSRRPGPPGSYFVVAVADAAGVVVETNEGNNATSRPLTVP
jgi:hypothetical protein